MGSPPIKVRRWMETRRETLSRHYLLTSSSPSPTGGVTNVSVVFRILFIALIQAAEDSGDGQTFQTEGWQSKRYLNESEHQGV